MGAVAIPSWRVGGSPAQLATYCIWDEYGFRSKLALDKVAVDDPGAAVKLGYAVCSTMPPPDSTLPGQAHRRRRPPGPKWKSSGVLAPGDVEQFMDDAVMWLC